MRSDAQDAVLACQVMPLIGQRHAIARSGLAVTVTGSAIGSRGARGASSAGVERLTHADAIRLLEDDAQRLAERSGAGDDRDGPLPVALAHRVEAVRLGLGPIRDPGLLAQSLAREAGLPRALVSEPGALRLGYAIRYVELTTGSTLPSWTPAP